MGDKSEEPTDAEAGGNLWTNSPSEAESQFEGIEASDFSAEAVKAATFDRDALEKRLTPYRGKTNRETLDKVLK